jgi:hypothetical protein
MTVALVVVLCHMMLYGYEMMSSPSCRFQPGHGFVGLAVVDDVIVVASLDRDVEFKNKARHTG